MAVYISNQTGNWNAASTWLTAADGRLSPTAAAGAAPQSGGGDKIIVRGGHVVTYNVNGEFGDQTSTYLAATTTSLISSNAIILSGGTLRASRTTNTELSCRGNLFIAMSGFFDWGTESDPVTAVNANITLNCLSAGSVLSSYRGYAGIYMLGQGSHGVYFNNKISIVGSYELRNTYLTVSAASGSTTITVNSLSGWQIGDKLIIESDINFPLSAIQTSSLSSTFITGINGNQVSLSVGLNGDRSVGTRVGNFSSNINIRSANSTQPSYGIYGLLSNLTQESTDVPVANIQNCKLENIGAGSWYGFNVGNNASSHALGAISLYNQYTYHPSKVQSVAIETNVRPTTVGTYKGIYHNGTGIKFTTIRDIATYMDVSNASYAFDFNSGVSSNLDSCVVYRATNGLTYNAGYPNSVIINNCYFNCNVGIGPVNFGLNSIISNSRFKCASWAVQLDSMQDLKINNSTIYYNTIGIVANNANAAGNVTFSDCVFGGPFSNNIDLQPNVTNFSNAKSEIRSVRTNNITTDYRSFNYYYFGVTNLNIRKNGTNSFRLNPRYANTSFNFYSLIPAINGVSQRILGNIRFDSTYGTTNPPTISFIGAGINRTFTCPAVADTWHKIDYTFNPTSTEDIEITVNGRSSATNGYVYIDGLTLDPFIQDARWYGFDFDKNFYRTVDTLTTLSESQVSALGSISNLDELYDASNYWSVTNPASSSYIDLYTINGTVLDFGTKNIIVNNTGTALEYLSATNTIVLDAPTLSAGTNFNTLKTSGTVTLSTGLISNIDINAPIVQTIPTNLTGVFMLSGTLSYNTNTPIEVEYTNCTMVGVQNTGTAIVTIKRTNSTVTESDAEITTYAPTLIDLTLQDGYIALYDDTGTRQYFQNTDGTLILPANATGNWSYKIARYGYQLLAGSFTVNPAVGGTIDISPAYTPDTFITQNDVSVVSGYTDLNTTDKIHDYLSYYLTTSTGINYGILDSESFGVLSFYGNLTLSNSATSVVEYTSGTNTLKLKSSSVNDSIIFVVASAFTQDGGNTIGDNLKIRASNIDSELYFNNVQSIVFYPTELDRDNNTNYSLSADGSIYRFKYGSTINGATFSNYIYYRVTVGGVTLLNTTPIAAGSTTIDFSTTGNIQNILANQRIINTGVQKASKLIPHTTNV